MITANSVHMQKFPFSSELDLTIMFFVIISIHLLLTQFIKYLFDIKIDSNFVLYLGVLLLIMILSNIFRLITLNGFQFSLLKLNIYCALGHTVALFILLFGLKDFLYFEFERDFQKLSVHLTAVLDGILDDHVIRLPYELFLFILIISSGLFMFLLTPSISRFAENYVKTIGRYYSYLEKEQKSANNENKGNEDENSTEKNLINIQEQKKNSWILRLFNLRLIFNLLLLFFWIKPMMSPWVAFIGSSEMLKLLRLLLCISYCILVAYAYKYELEAHFSKIYESLKTLLVDPGDINFFKVKSRVSNLVQTSLMITYIIITKFIIPLLFLYVIIYKSNFSIKTQVSPLIFRDYKNFSKLKLTNLQKSELLMYNSDWNCMVTKNITEILWQAKNSPIHASLILEKKGIGLWTYGGKKEKISDNYIKVMKDVLRKINVYGFIPDEFYQNLLSFWVFTYLFGNYFLAVFYIIFLRKSNNL